MSQECSEKDYYTENYPYHVEMLSKFTLDGDMLTIYYENGKTSQFSVTELQLTQEVIKARLEGQSGNIVYIYQDPEKTKDIAVELLDITGCCSGTRKLLLGY